jgi:hypothetical protein
LLVLYKKKKFIYKNSLLKIKSEKKIIKKKEKNWMQRIVFNINIINKIKNIINNK